MVIWKMYFFLEHNDIYNIIYIYIIYGTVWQVGRKKSMSNMCPQAKVLVVWLASKEHLVQGLWQH